MPTSSNVFRINSAKLFVHTLSIVVFDGRERKIINDIFEVGKLLWGAFFRTPKNEADWASQRIIYKLFYSKVYEAARYIVKDRDLAEDIVQQTFEKAFLKIHTLQDDQKIEAWLIQICKRTAIDYWRKNKKERDLLVSDDILYSHKASETIDDEIERQMLIEELMNCLNNISFEHQNILQKKYLNGLTYKEIAIELGATEGSIREALSRARKKLKTCLQRKWGDLSE
jgi:RNA polymerase sigma factor (sigma-70 family)